MKSICCGFFEVFFNFDTVFVALKVFKSFHRVFFVRKFSVFNGFGDFRKNDFVFLHFYAIFYHFLLYFRVFFDFFLNFGFGFKKCFLLLFVFCFFKMLFENCAPCFLKMNFVLCMGGAACAKWKKMEMGDFCLLLRDLFDC